MSVPVPALNVWLVDDDPFDVKLMLRAIDKLGLTWKIRIFRDGDEVCDAAGPGDPELPNLILLDMNLPRRNGREVLEFLRRQPKTQAIPVVIVTTSTRPTEVLACYKAGANTYLKKPRAFRELVGLLESVGDYWGNLAELPMRLG